jgi:hypothetical protein
MKLSLRWSVVPTTIVAVLAMTGMATSQTVPISPNSSTVTLNGTSGGSKKDTTCAGFIANAPNHRIEVKQDSNLRFSLQGAGEPTLLITGAQGQSVCVQADSLSGGKIEIPGRWNQGVYSIFVGDRAQNRSPYKLSITPTK